VHGFSRHRRNGGSAGSIPTLTRIVCSLPTEFPAAVFVILHLRSREKSQLAEILARAGRLDAVRAHDAQRIEQGMTYVAPPDHHMVIAAGHIHLSRGPKEGLHRPSINATFRSAALAYRSRVVGVLLSGMLDDGASGLWDIVYHRGISIVQDPEEAKFPSMPINALEDVPINYKLRSQEIGPRLVDLVTSPEPFPTSEELTVNDIPPERFSGFTCPECRGALFEHRQKPPEFRCLVGHIFPLETLIEESTATQERKMYEAVVSLEEGARMAEFASKNVAGDEKKQLLSEAKQLRTHAMSIRQLVEERQTPPVDS